MGQLEKYGLYVLCLVIFLILGVAIWGGDPTAPTQPGKEIAKLATPEGGKAKEQPREQPKEPAKDAVKDPAKPPAGTDAAKPQGKEPQGKEPQSRELEGFFTPVPSKTEKKDGADKTPGAKPTDGKPTDAKATDAKVAAEPPKPRVYVVQNHDTLSKIAERELGSRGRVAEIEALNPTIKKGLIHKGDQIKLPAPKPANGTDAPKKGDEKADRVAKADKPAPGRSYRVQSGDTLTSISRAAYGNDKHVREIWAANRGKLANANTLPNNVTLLLP